MCKQQTLFLLTIFLCRLSLPSSASIGIYNYHLNSTDGSIPAAIEYRLNCAASVSIEILDEGDNVVCSLGPWSEAAGLHSHLWDGAGMDGQSHCYSARISATAPQTGIPGTLTRLAGEKSIGYIYGLAVDNCPSSPGYGTIYVSRTIPGGEIRAYYPDGTPNNSFGPDPATNALDLGFHGVAYTAPWGVGVDEMGNVYAACRSEGSATGVKVFDRRGNQLHHVFTDEPQGNFWLAGLADGNRMEIYESVGSTVRRADTATQDWEEIIRFPAGMTARQFSFEPGGRALHVAVSGNNDSAPNRGVWRFVRQADGSWLCDSGFNPGLSALVSANDQLASWYATGVSCDAVDPDGTGPRECGSIWIGLDVTSVYFGGNVIRMALPDGGLDMFSTPGKVSRIVAADAVGNVALEYDVSDSTSVWSSWGIYAPGGEASSDTRTTDPVTLSGTPVVVSVDSIAVLRALGDGREVELTSPKVVSAVYEDGCYLAEPDHSGGIRVEGLVSAAEGVALKVRGSLVTRFGERVITGAEVVP